VSRRPEYDAIGHPTKYWVARQFSLARSADFKEQAAYQEYPVCWRRWP
jgi:hypothetical protein